MTDETRLQRWSRLKRQGSLPEAAEPEPEQPPEPVEVESSGEVVETTEPAPVLGDADMPPLESLTASSDVSMFFSQGVSPELRQQALRKLFHQPEFNVRCPLDEYAEDYSQPEKLLAGTAARLKGWAGEQVKAWVDEQMTQPAAGQDAPVQQQTASVVEETGTSPETPASDPDRTA